MLTSAIVNIIYVRELLDLVHTGNSELDADKETKIIIS
jgi:hypothetical protein